MLSVLQVLAQDKKKTEKKDDQEKTPVFNYVIDDPMDAFGPKGEAVDTNRFFLFPEFYSYWPVTINDTVLKYECYDAMHLPLNMDTLRNLSDLHYVSFIKFYTDYLQTGIDQEGKPQPLKIANILYKYERTGSDTWTALDNINHYTTTLQEQTKNIVRADTSIITNKLTGGKQLTIRRYYKVVEVAKDNEVNPENKTISNEAPASVATYLVPEFYFHQPKTIKDTTLEFLCYDNRDSLIPNVENYDDVRYYSLFKKFTDTEHTYTDKDGSKKPLPVSFIVKRYDASAKDKWMSIEYPGNKLTELKGFKNIIVSSDTEKVKDPVTDKQMLRVYNRYKVIKN